MGRRTDVGYKPIVVVGVLVTAALGCGACGATAPTSSALPWDLDSIDAPAAWQVTKGAGVLIAILDSGLADQELPGMHSREVMPASTSAGRRLASPDTDGHGTAVATLAAGSGDLGVWGVAPAANVMPINVTDPTGTISADAVVLGIDDAVRDGASVINLSFGMVSDNPGIHKAIDFAVARGVVIVAAAGDTSAPTPLFPASMVNEVIAVRALDQDGQPSLRANRVGPNGIDAPGQNLPSVRLVNNAAEVAKSDGSSMAAALVSGSIALLESCVHRKSLTAPSEEMLVKALRESRKIGPWFDLRAALQLVGC